MPKLVFSRCSGKPSTATRHPGPKTGTVFSVRENPSKSPKRPALPGAVNWEGAVLRHRPFVLLVFHTLSAAMIRAFFHWPNTGLTRAFLGWDGYFPYPGKKLRTQGHTGCNRRDWVSFRLVVHTLSAALIQTFFHWPNTGPTRAFLGLGRVLSLHWEETPHTGPHGAQQAGLGFFPVVSTSELVCFVYSWEESVSSRNSRTVGGTWRS